MKRTLLLLLLPLLLTSCSNPDTSGGVTLSRGGDDANEFPHGSCEGKGKNPPGGSTGCGWIHANEESYYIRPSAGLYYANLSGADLDGAILRGAGLGLADLSGADLSGAILHGAELGSADLSGADLSGADLILADLTDADLTDADLRDADLSNFGLRGVKANSRTTCPNGKKWGTAGNDCPF